MRIASGFLAIVFLLFTGFGALMCVMASESLVVGGTPARMKWFGAAALWVGVPLLGAAVCLRRLWSGKGRG